VAPTYSNVNGDSTFKLRGVIDADHIAFHEREGRYDYNSGTGFRRARIGLEGDAFLGQIKWRIEADFAGNVVGLTDAYVQFVSVRPWQFTFGQHKAFYGLEANNSDNNNVFLERAMFSNAFGTAGAERRFGISAFRGTDTFTAGIGIFGDNESATRVATAPDESIGVNGRVTWAPLLEPEHILQLGLSGYYRDDLKEGGFADAIRLSDRPNVRVDGGNLAETGVIRQVESLSYLGAEAVYIHGPLTLAGEYGKARAERKAGLDHLDFDGGYVFGTWFLTGESRGLKVGNFDRVKPWRDFDWNKGTWGAFELLLRYDRFDFSETPIAANHGNRGDSVTAGLNWYLNGNLKLLLNWVHFQGERTPLDPFGNAASGDALAARVHLDW
jgi:phosphate-selective porin OprO/OprP